MRGSATRNEAEACVQPVQEDMTTYGDRMARAVRMISNLKSRLSNKPDLLSSLVALLHSVIANQQEVQEARRQMKELLDGDEYSDLLAEALLFLPLPLPSKVSENGTKCLSQSIEKSDQCAEDKSGDDNIDDDDGSFGEDGGNENGHCANGGTNRGEDGRRRYKKRHFSEEEIANLFKGVKRYARLHSELERKSIPLMIFFSAGSDSANGAKS